MKLFNIIFDTRIIRLLFHKIYWRNNWDIFINSLLPHEPEWEEGEHLIVTPTSIRLEVIGVSLKKINTELEEKIQIHKKILAAYKTDQDQDCDLLDALMLFCESFYKSHPTLSIEALKNLSEIQFNHFSEKHELGQPLHLHIIENWIGSLVHPLAYNEFCRNLSWDSIGRFIDICRFEHEAEDRQETSLKRDLSMLKVWANLLTNNQRNLSGYRFVSRICDRDNSEWSKALRPVKGLSLLDDAGDSDIVHSFIFGNFSYLKKSDNISHYSVIVFIRKDEAQVFLERAKLYKVFLESLHESMGLEIILKLGIAYLIDPVNCRVVGSISAEEMSIRLF